MLEQDVTPIYTTNNCHTTRTETTKSTVSSEILPNFCVGQLLLARITAGIGTKSYGCNVLANFVSSRLLVSYNWFVFMIILIVSGCRNTNHSTGENMTGHSFALFTHHKVAAPMVILMIYIFLLLLFLSIMLVD